MERRDLVAAALFALLTLPFHPHWLDFEMARRGLAMLVGAGALIALAMRGETLWPRGSKWFAGFVGLAAALATGRHHQRA